MRPEQKYIIEITKDMFEKYGFTITRMNVLKGMTMLLLEAENKNRIIQVWDEHRDGYGMYFMSKKEKNDLFFHWLLEKNKLREKYFDHLDTYDSKSTNERAKYFQIEYIGHSFSFIAKHDVLFTQD